jgi:hypothetical protein
MSAKGRDRGVFLLVGFALGVVGGLLIPRGADGVPNAPARAPVAEPAEFFESGSRVPTTKARRRRGREGDAPAAAAQSAPVPVVHAARDDDAPAAPPTTLDVVVQRADGSVVAAGDVYALPAGASSAESLDHVPHAAIGADGRCRLTLPCAGAFDVGALVGERESATVTTVDAPTAFPVRLVVPPTAETTLTPDASLAGRTRETVEICVGHWADRVPGKGRFRYAEWTTGIGAAGSFDLPAGAPVRLRPQTAVRAEPEEFAAPARVRFVPEDRALVRVTFAAAPADARPSVRGYVRLDGCWDGDDRERRVFDWAWEVDPSKPLGALRANVSLRVPAEGRTLRWSGLGVKEGVVRLAPTPEVVEATFEIDDAALRAEFVLEEAVLRATAPVGVEGDVRFDLWSADGAWGSAWSETVDSTIGAVETVACRPGTWVAARRGDLVAAPRPIAERGETTLELRPGGHLVVLAQPELARGLVLRRKDGAQIPVRTSADETEPDSCDDAAPRNGVVIGPLPEGDAAFVVLLAGVPVRELRAKVTAGRHEPLRVDLSSPAK